MAQPFSFMARLSSLILIMVSIATLIALYRSGRAETKLKEEEAYL